MKRLTPKQMVEHVTKMAANIKKASSLVVAVGLPKGKGTSAIYEGGMNVVEIGAVHEYGASFMHPGGTAYVFGKGGKAKFVSSSRGGKVAGFTKPHMINIPQRSFLRVPFKLKESKITKALLISFRGVLEDGKDPEKQLEKVGVLFQNISKGAFTSMGYGTWQPTKKGGTPLFNTGTLRGSITSEVRNAS